MPSQGVVDFATAMAGVVSGAVQRRRELEMQRLEQQAEEKEFQRRQQLMEKQASLGLETQKSLEDYKRQVRKEEERAKMLEPAFFIKMFEDLPGADPLWAADAGMNAYSKYWRDPMLQNAPEYAGPYMARDQVLNELIPPGQNYPYSEQYQAELEESRAKAALDRARAAAELGDAGLDGGVDFQQVYRVTANALKTLGLPGPEYADSAFLQQFNNAIAALSAQYRVEPSDIDALTVLRDQFGFTHAQHVPRNNAMTMDLVQYYSQQLLNEDGGLFPHVSELSQKIETTESGLAVDRTRKKLAGYIASRIALPDAPDADQRFNPQAIDSSIGPVYAYGKEYMSNIAAAAFSRDEDVMLPEAYRGDPNAPVLDRETVNRIFRERHGVAQLMSTDYPPDVSPAQVTSEYYLVRHQDIPPISDAVATLREVFSAQGDTVEDEAERDTFGDRSFLQYIMKGIQEPSTLFRERP